jgi:4-hydroxybenzoate polyprenyltransferase
MTQTQRLRGDMPVGGWIDRFAPAALRPYLLLMRLDRPIGTWLLLLPCWWSIALAGGPLPEAWRPDLWLMALFGVGAVVMRGAGCTVNDIADREFDAKVARTAARPIASGAVTVPRAVAFLGLQLLVGLLILLQLPPFAIAVGAASLLLVGPYPLMKRFTYWPQAWLGLTFNWGALLGWAAATGTLAWPPVLLYLGGVFWTLGYDTIYAHQDKEDDVLVGVKSTALALGERTVPALAIFYSLALALFGAAGAAAGLGWGFYVGLAAAAAHAIWQITRVDIHHALDCLAKFKSNRDFGLIMLAAVMAGKVW